MSNLFRYPRSDLCPVSLVCGRMKYRLHVNQPYRGSGVSPSSWRFFILTLSTHFNIYCHDKSSNQDTKKCHRLRKVTDAKVRLMLAQLKGGGISIAPPKPGITQFILHSGPLSTRNFYKSWAFDPIRLSRYMHVWVTSRIKCRSSGRGQMALSRCEVLLRPSLSYAWWCSEWHPDR